VRRRRENQSGWASLGFLIENNEKKKRKAVRRRRDKPVQALWTTITLVRGIFDSKLIQKLLKVNSKGPMAGHSVGG
jgi:hypothetical protein